MLKKYYLLMIGLVSCSPNLDEKAFFARTTGQYTLNETGVSFLRRELKLLVGVDGDTIEFRGDGTFSLLISATDSVPIAQFIELKKENQGVFQLAGTNRFVAMGLETPLWIATTNSEASVESVLVEHLVPIASKKGI